MISIHQFIDLIMKEQVPVSRVDALVPVSLIGGLTLSEMINLRPLGISEWSDRDINYIRRVDQIIDHPHVRHATSMWWHVRPGDDALEDGRSAVGTVVMEHMIHLPHPLPAHGDGIHLVCRRLRNEVEATLTRRGHDVKHHGTTIHLDMPPHLQLFDTCLHISVSAAITVSQS